MNALRRLALAPGPLHILAIGAHADDIEIGAGGTLLRLLGERPGSSVTWLVLSADAIRRAEARASAAAFAGDAPLDLHIRDLPDGRFPTVLGELKDALEAHTAVEPDLILCPQAGDAHQDHRAVAEVVLQTYRHHLVLGYEIAKYDGDMGQPNVFVALDAATLDRKIALLHAGFPSQHGRTWWDEESFRALPRLRGIEAATTYAEGFYGRKLVL